MKNTFTQGNVRTIVFYDKEDACWYGAALELGITVDGDSPDYVAHELREAILGYIEAAKEIGDESVLNKTPIQEYEELWQKSQQNMAVPSPFVIDSIGTQKFYA